MTDAEALAEINRILNLAFEGEFSPYDALNKIAYITGLNRGTK